MQGESGENGEIEVAEEVGSDGVAAPNTEI